MIVVVLPTDSPAIHLDMIFTMVDRTHCVVYPPYFFGPQRLPALHYRPGGEGVKAYDDVFTALKQVGMALEPIWCGGQHPTRQEREQWSSGCNFVAVRPGVVLGYSRNEGTMREMQEAAGYRVVDAIDFLTGKDQVRDGDKAVIAFEGCGAGARRRRRPLHDHARLPGRHLVSQLVLSLEGVRLERDGSLTDRALRVLSAEPLPSVEVASRVLGITGGGGRGGVRPCSRCWAATRAFAWTRRASGPSRRRRPREEPAIVRPLREESFVVVDVETTGGSPYARPPRHGGGRRPRFRRPHRRHLLHAGQPGAADPVA